MHRTQGWLFLRKLWPRGFQQGWGSADGLLQPRRMRLLALRGWEVGGTGLEERQPSAPPNPVTEMTDDQGGDPGAMWGLHGAG